jgi:hypothetical protein
MLLPALRFPVKENHKQNCNCVLGDTEDSPDFLIASAICDLLQDLPLPFGKFRMSHRSRKFRCDRRRKWEFAFRGSANSLSDLVRRRPFDQVTGGSGS